MSLALELLEVVKEQKAGTITREQAHAIVRAAVPGSVDIADDLFPKPKGGIVVTTMSADDAASFVKALEALDDKNSVGRAR